MSDAVPPAARCTEGGCEREAVDPDHPAGLCPAHHPARGDDSGGGEEGNQQDRDDTSDVLVKNEPAGNRQPEAESSESNPTPDADTSQPDSGGQALADAIDWFHARIDDPIRDHTTEGQHEGRPTTAREWFEDVRGFDTETIEDKRLGWAPPNAGDDLIDYLTLAGHSHEAIRATGLFTEDLWLLWNGRYVFPYFDSDGDPAYAIGRCTGGLGGGNAGYDGHPDDFLAGKYAKLAHTRDYVTTDEPIYGVRTLDRDGPVLITEGVADAIRAHEAGYACLSPVTTQFKNEHLPPLLDRLGDTDRAVYVVQDSEPPAVEYTDDADGWGALAVDQFGPGLKGGLRTAARLRDSSLDAWVAELPRMAAGKVDLDDYLGEWADTLAPVLASAKPPECHRGYGAATSGDTQAQRQHDDRDGDDGGDHDARVTETEEEADSPTPDRTLTHAEVTRALDAVDTGLLYDDWIQLLHAVHDWDPGVRGKATVERWAQGSLTIDQNPKWSPESQDHIDWVWRNAERGRDMDTDPTNPTTVATLIHRATRDSDWSPDWQTEDAKPTSAVPVGLLNKLDDDEARRVARQHGVDWPDTTEARQQLRDRVLTAVHGGERTVLDAPTALGKSYTVATEPWRTRADAAGDRPVVQFHETREARDQAVEHSSNAGVTYRVLRGRTEACDCAAGDHDPAEGDEDNDRQVITMDGTPASQWFKTVCEDQGRGVPFSVAHQYLAEHNDQGVDLPCGGDGCLGITQWNGVPTDDDGQVTADVIHATHGFAHVPSLRLNTNMVFDERPDFDTELATDRVQQIITAYLRHVDAPVETWEQFVATARTASDDAHSRQHRDRIGDAIEAEPSRDWYLEDPDAHTLAPALTRAVWFALLGGTDTNGRFDATVPHQPPRLDAEASGDDGWNRVWLSVVLDDDHRVRTARTAPDVSQARSVIGLDAHPTPSLWTANLGEDMTRDTVLDTDARRHWRRLERGLTIVQVGEATRPYTSGEYFDHEGTGELVDALREEFGADFGTAITAASVEADHRDLLVETGVDDPETMHYGEQKSRDDFATERVGLVSGCIDPGDGYVLDLLAELGCDAEPELTECPECDGAGCEADPDCRDGQRRAHGREFVGDDADTASALLASVRENHVAQAAGRYARDADGDGGALVFVRTDAMPPGYADLQVPGVEWVPTNLQAEIIDTLAERPAATAAEIADTDDCTKEHVRETLVELHDRGVVDVREGGGDHGAHLYRALAGVDTGAGVALEDEGTTNDAVWGSYTWSLAISPPTTSASVTQRTSTRPTTADRPEHQAGLTAFGDTPPPG